MRQYYLFASILFLPFDTRIILHDNQSQLAMSTPANSESSKNRTNMIKYKDSVNFDWRDAYDLNEHKKDIALQKIKTDRRQEMIGVFENSRSDELRRRLRLRRREEMENEPLPLYEGVLPTYEDVVRGMGEMRG